MPTTQLVSLSEYLESARYKRFEYEAGVVTEKPMPNWKHGDLCAWITALIFKFFPQYRAAPEVRSRLKEDRWRLPDIIVDARSRYGEVYAFTPPHLCIEILSEEDTPAKIFTKCRQYHDWGVLHCWIFDPEARIAWQFDPGSEPLPVTDRIAAGEIHFSVERLFQCLDDGFIPDL